MKPNNRLTAFFFNFVLILSSFQLVASDNKFESINIAAPSSAPFVFKDEKGNAQGFLVDLLALVEQESGIKINIAVMPWPRGVHEVKVGHKDALMPTIYTDDRAQYLIYPKMPLIEFNTVLLKRTQDKLVVDDITQLGTEKVIVKIRGMSMGKVFDDAEKAKVIKVIEVRDFDHAIQMLATSRADLVACVDYIANFSLKRLNLLDKITTLNYSNKKVPAYLTFSKAYAEKYDINFLLAKIDNVKISPEYQALVVKYLK